jgi:hypothetical protein
VQDFLHPQYDVLRIGTPLNLVLVCLSLANRDGTSKIFASDQAMIPRYNQSTSVHDHHYLA